MKGKIISSYPIGKGQRVTTVEHEDDCSVDFIKLMENFIDITIKKWYKHRSLDANRYLWHLAGEIAKKVRSTKDEIYLDLIRKYAPSDFFDVREDVNINRHFKYYDVISEFVSPKGIRYIRIKSYVGSSGFDVAEMAAFLDKVVEEAEYLGIPTETPNKIAEMKSLWESCREKWQ